MLTSFLGRWVRPQTVSSYEKAHSALDALLHEGDNEALDITMATIVGNRIGGDAVAILLLAPPSSGKTEIVLACKTVPDTYWISTVTANTLASGLSRDTAKTETSLLYRLRDEGKTTLLFKEFGSVLSMNDAARAELIGQLREVIDGQYRKRFGTGLEIDWHGTLGMVAASTPQIERLFAVFRELGDRWLVVRLDDTNSDRIAQALAAQTRTGGLEDQLRERLQAAVKNHMAGLKTGSLDDVGCSEEYRLAIAKAADYLARVRAPAHRDGSGRVLSIAAPEGPARLAKALNKLARCVAIVRGRKSVEQKDLLTVLRIVDDSVPSERNRLLHALDDGPKTQEELRRNLPRAGSTISADLRELELLGFVVKRNGEPTGERGRPTYFWSRSSGEEFLDPLTPYRC